MRTCYVYMSVVLIALAVCVESQSGALLAIHSDNPCEAVIGTWARVSSLILKDRDHEILLPAEVTSLKDYQEYMCKDAVVQADCDLKKESADCKLINNEITTVLRRHGPAQTTPTPTASSAAQLKHRQLQVLALGLLAVLTHVTQPL